MFKNRLTAMKCHASLRIFSNSHVKNLRHHRIEARPRQHYSPSRYG
jgi:hypothetical protein